MLASQLSPRHITLQQIVGQFLVIKVLSDSESRRPAGTLTCSQALGRTSKEVRTITRAGQDFLDRGDWVPKTA